MWLLWLLPTVASHWWSGIFSAFIVACIDRCKGPYWVVLVMKCANKKILFLQISDMFTTSSNIYLYNNVMHHGLGYIFNHVIRHHSKHKARLYWFFRITCIYIGLVICLW